MSVVCHETTDVEVRYVVNLIDVYKKTNPNLDHVLEGFLLDYKIFDVTTCKTFSEAVLHVLYEYDISLPKISVLITDNVLHACTNHGILV